MLAARCRGVHDIRIEEEPEPDSRYARAAGLRSGRRLRPLLQRRPGSRRRATDPRVKCVTS